MKRNTLCAFLLATLGLLPQAFADSSYSSTVLSRDDLDPISLRENALDTLLNERLQKVIRSAGVPAGDFETSVTVKAVESIPTPKPSKKPANNRKPSDAPKFNKDAPPESSFEDSSLFSTDHLLKKYRDDQRREMSEAVDREDPIDDEEDPELPKKEYVVDHVYMHVALGEKVQKDISDQMDAVVKNAFSPVFGTRFSYDVQKGIRAPEKTWINWVMQGIEWATQLKWLILTLLLTSFALFAFVLFRKLSSWQAKWTKRTAHAYEEKADTRHAEDRKETFKEELPEQKEEKLPEPLPPPPPVAETESPELIMRKRVARLKKQIVTFAAEHNQVVQRVLQEWANAADDEGICLKINMLLELLVSHSIVVGKVEMRPNLLTELRKTKKKALEIELKDKLELFDAIYWDCISTGQLTHESKAKSLAFLDSADDRAVLEILRKEDPRVQARILVSIDEKRAAQLLSKLPTAERKSVLSHLFDSDSSMSNITLEEGYAMAERLSQRLARVLEEQAALGAMQGIEGFVPILRSMDFETQFAAARGFLGLDQAAKTRIFSNYFNVSLLPAVKTEFLAKIFLDRPSDWILRITSQFGDELRKNILELLPPMQQRMLASSNPEGISKGEAMEALAGLNKEVLERLSQGKLTYSDIFELELNGTSRAA